MDYQLHHSSFSDNLRVFLKWTGWLFNPYKNPCRAIGHPDTFRVGSNLTENPSCVYSLSEILSAIAIGHLACHKDQRDSEQSQHDHVHTPDLQLSQDYDVHWTLAIAEVISTYNSATIVINIHCWKIS